MMGEFVQQAPGWGLLRPGRRTVGRRRRVSPDTGRLGRARRRGESAIPGPTRSHRRVPGRPGRQGGRIPQRHHAVLAAMDPTALPLPHVGWARCACMGTVGSDARARRRPTCRGTRWRSGAGRSRSPTRAGHRRCLAQDQCRAGSRGRWPPGAVHGEPNLADTRATSPRSKLTDDSRGRTPAGAGWGCVANAESRRAKSQRSGIQAAT